MADTGPSQDGAYSLVILLQTRGKAMGPIHGMGAGFRARV
jgi:hypothetical protein